MGKNNKRMKVRKLKEGDKVNGKRERKKTKIERENNTKSKGRNK